MTTRDTMETRLGAFMLPAADGEPVRSWLDLVRDVARTEGVDYHDILSTLRSRSVVRARHRAWMRLTEYGYSLNEIATRWGAHHTTVMAALRKVAPPPVSQTRLRFDAAPPPTETPAEDAWPGLVGPPEFDEWMAWISPGVARTMEARAERVRATLPKKRVA